MRIYESRTGSDAVVVDGDTTYSSSAALGVSAIPQDIYDGIGDQIRDAAVRVGHRDYRVVAGLGPNREHYAFFFSLDQLKDGLRELRAVLVGGWIGLIAIAIGAGGWVARRTLRPVREAAIAATALASGMLDTRIPTRGDDEFGDWARSFNSMANALEQKIDELNRAAERERQFTANVAHDLRTPLTGMSATASLLKEQLPTLPTEAQAAIAVLIHDTERLKDLVLELLELSRLDARSEPLFAEDLCLADAVHATIDSLMLPDAVHITVDCPADLAVRAERVRFRRALGNVLANASTHGGGAIAISALLEGDTVAIRVRDHGPGIRSDQGDQIFDRFFRGDASRSSDGAGLGLAIAREHARAQGGDLTACSHSASGAVFTLRLPAVNPVRPT